MSSHNDRNTERPAGQVSDLREIGPVASGLRTPLDSAALERLYQLAVELPFEAGTQAVARMAVERASELCPGLALGLCVIDPVRGGQLVELRVPPDFPPSTEHDPSRLFPGLAFEQSVPLGDELAGTSLHVGAEDPQSFDERARAIVDRLVPLVERAILRAQEFDRGARAEEALRELRTQVIQAEKLASLGQIVAGVVHELQNPLTSIIAYATYLERRLAAQGNPDDVARAERIGEAAERILRFSRDLVAYARPSADVPGPVPIHEVIDKALVFCEHELERAGVVVAREWNVELPLVLGISGQLTQVFVNLFTNAAHAMAARGGRLTITTTLDDDRDRVLITVIDDGVGIDAAHLDRVFEPFFSTKTEGRGTGLGLSIVRDIVTAHQGSVRVESTLDQGARFTLELPAAARRVSTRPPSE